MQEAASGEGAHPRKDASFQGVAGVFSAAWRMRVTLACSLGLARLTLSTLTDLAAAGVEEYKALMEAASPFAFPQVSDPRARVILPSLQLHQCAMLACFVSSVGLLVFLVGMG